MEQGTLIGAICAGITAVWMLGPATALAVANNPQLKDMGGLIDLNEVAGDLVIMGNEKLGDVHLLGPRTAFVKILPDQVG